MGFPKALLAPARGDPVVLSLCRALREGGVEVVACTLPPGDVVAPSHRLAVERLRERLDRDGVRMLANERWGEGLLGSVRSVLGRVRPAGALVVTPVDAPGATPGLVQGLLCAWSRNPGEPVFPVVAGRPGHPLVVPAGLFPVVEAHPGEGGLRVALGLAARPGVAWQDVRVCASLDTPAQASAWEPRLGCWDGEG
jgi:CTP:molybdopterin cytidylyltransferase MocA